MESSPRWPTKFRVFVGGRLRPIGEELRDRAQARSYGRTAPLSEVLDVAKVAELVDALDLGSSGATRGSSSLPFRTTVHIRSSLP